MTALRQRTIDLMQYVSENDLPKVYSLVETLTNKSKEVTREEGLAAFYEMRNQVQEAGVPEMTLDEINAEIAEARRERRIRKAAME